MEKEIWKAVVGYEGLYEVSNFGRVKSLERTVFSKGKPARKQYERIMKTPLLKTGYPHTSLQKDSKAKTVYVHRLVAEAFISNPENKRTVNHIDGNKANNLVSNLEWATFKENSKHAYNTGLRLPSDANKNGKLSGEKNYISKVTNEDVMFIRANSKFNGGLFSTSELAKKYNLDPRTVLSILKNETWSHLSMSSEKKSLRKSNSGYESVYCVGVRYKGLFTHNKKKYHCGLHETPEEAYAAVIDKRKELGGLPDKTW